MIRALFCMTLLVTSLAFYAPGALRSSSMLRMEGEAVPETSAAATEVVIGESKPKPVASAISMSQSLPFMMQPRAIEGMVGDVGFDPLGFSDTFDVKFLREAELKHGRVAMLAIVGCLMTMAGVHLPGAQFETTNIIDAPIKAGPSAMLQIIAGVGFMESINHGGKMSPIDMFEDSDREPGYFSAPIYGAKRLNGMKEEKVTELKLKELKNGRLAMFGIGGMIHHQIIYGSETLGDFSTFNPFIHH
jgi:light-harvesting complex I chlorophyll a/b binding protein 4